MESKSEELSMEITVHGTPVELLGRDQKVGKEAPAARVDKLDGTKNVIGMVAPTAQLLIAIPSLKTEVCSLGAKKFNDLIKSFPKLTTYMITTDDPEFVSEYAQKEGIDSAELLIDTDRNFAKKYGLLISEGKLRERLARAVYVIDREGVIAYKEVVPEIVDEVDYDKCIEALKEATAIKKGGHTHEEWMSV
jgi:thiol peroxidase